MRGVVPTHLADRFRTLDRMQPADPDAPWMAKFTIHAGGLWHVGFGDDSDLLLLISVSGRGVVDCVTGEKIARDDEDYYPDAQHLKAEGIGPLAGMRINVAGVHGGALSRMTNDGWSIELHPLSWPDEELFLCPPGETMLVPDRGNDEAIKKLLPPISPLVAYGFSPTGKSLVVATSSEVTIYRR